MESKSFTERLNIFMKSKEIVEIDAFNKTITGKITEVGKNFIAVTSEIEREITRQVPTDGGSTVPEKSFIIIELETFLRFKDINAISRIKKQRER